MIANGQLPITDLARLKLSDSAASGGTDAATVTYDGEAYTATIADKLTDIASGWTQAEFNVLGNAGGSLADFNSGASLTVKVVLTDGSTTAPTCIPPSDYDGTTGETNNLNLGTCTAAGGCTPSIEFTESLTSGRTVLRHERRHSHNAASLPKDAWNIPQVTCFGFRISAPAKRLLSLLVDSND